MTDETQIEPTDDLSSAKGRLRAAVQEASSQHTIDLTIPGENWKGMLVARYKRISALVEGKTINERVKRQFQTAEDRALYGSIDQLIVACVGFYFREDDGSLTLINDDGQGPMGYDERLASYLGFKADSARDTLLKVFSGLENDVLILAHVRKFNQWMEDPTSAVTLGEA